MLFIYSLNVGLIKSIYCLEDGYSLYLGVKKLFCLASPPHGRTIRTRSRILTNLPRVLDANKPSKILQLL